MNSTIRPLITKIVALIFGFVGAFALVFISVFPQLYPLAGIMVGWWLVMGLMVHASRVRAKHLLLFICTSIASVALFILIEWPILRLLLVVLTGLIFAALWWWATLEHTVTILFRQKPWRRIVMMVWVFTVYAFLTLMQSWHVFFPTLSVALLALGGGLYSGFAAYKIWSLYTNIKATDYFVPVAVITLIMIEVSLVMFLLPFGYFALGLFMTWAWYLMQLFTRFHFGRRDILWRKQAWFLATNATLYLVTLYFARFL